MGRDDVIVRARLAEKAERFEDMAKAMKTICEMGIFLSDDERNMFSYAYNNLSGQKRISWRVISDMEQQLTATGEPWKCEKIQNYREKIQGELEELCKEVLLLISKYLLPLARTDESKVFYSKMNGDYLRYQAEIIGDPEKQRKMVSSADKAYRQATELAASTLRPAHPLRLGLALNYSVFLYEAKAANKAAIKHAKEAFEAAAREFSIGVFRLEEYKDSTIVLQLLNDNVKTWSSSEGTEINLLPD